LQLQGTNTKKKEEKRMMTETEFNKLSEKERLNSTLEGTFYYAWVNKPKYSEKYKTNTFQINVILDEANVAKAKALGLKVNDPDKYNPGPWVQIKRKVKDMKEVDDVRPEVVDSLQKPVPSDIIIGNDSKGIVKFGRFWHQNNGGGVSTVLFKIQIRDLVEFKPVDTSLAMDEGGFKAPTNQAQSEPESSFDD
jgi:hypothetical protein